MTYRGKLIGLNRYGITKMKSSPFMLASFEKTSEILFDAAFFGTIEPFSGATEKIILGQNVKIGTGTFDIIV
jgi:DNA-directed RNA polymerase III subunit RPC1